MSKSEAIFYSVLFSLIASFFGWMVFVAKPERDAQEALRQQQVNTFYAAHNCRPHDYVASKYSPVRTYQCDNGIFITSDMK